MIHHISIPAKDPKHVAMVLSELLNGEALPFHIVEGCYMVYGNDSHGTAIEVIPNHYSIEPNKGEGFIVNTGKTEQSNNLWHAAISVSCDESQLINVCKREGWNIRKRDNGPFAVMEIWIENQTMLEFLTPQMAQDYLKVSNSNSYKHMAKNFPKKPKSA